MTAGRYIEGILLFAVALVPLHTASYLWRSKLLAAWSGGQARLAEIIADVTVVVGVCEVLGSVRLYRLAPVVIALAVVGLGAIWAATRFRAREPAGHVPPAAFEGTSAPRVANAGALVVVSVVLAEWSTRTIAAYHHGMFSVDTLWYHMPVAARFVQDGSITALHYTDSQPDTVFYPATSELLHSFGILLLGNDVLSPLLNMLWLGLALLASWCIGKRFGVAPVSLTGTAILFATPGLVATQPGGAYDDVVGIALLLSSVALLLNAQDLSRRSTQVAWVLAAAAAGLAVGTKYTFIGPVIALTAGIAFLASRGKRVQSVGLWLVVVLLVGGFWYGRNYVAVGNPIPSFHLKLGPLSLPSPHLGEPTSTVAHFLFDSDAWHRFFIPGLRLSFGPAWWALLALSLLGLVLAVITGNRPLRVLGAVGLASGVLFLVTPQILTNGIGGPFYFVYNVRYNDAAVVLGLVLLPMNPMLSAWRRARWVLLAYGAILAATQFDASIWPTSLSSKEFAAPVRGSDSLLGLLVGVAVLIIGAAVILYRSEPRRPRVPAPAWAVLSLIVLIAAFPLQQTYLRDRYTAKDETYAGAYGWFQHLDNARVGVAGVWGFLQYPFYGRSLTNYVEYLGVRGPHGGYSSLSSCQQWQKAIEQGHYSYVLITTLERPHEKFTLVPEMKWTAAGGDAKLILDGVGNLGTGVFAIYKLGPHFSAGHCTSSNIA